MIATIIQTALELAMTLIGIFVKDEKRNQALKNNMFKMVEDHATNVSKNVQLRKEYEALKQAAKTPPSDTPQGPANR